MKPGNRPGGYLSSFRHGANSCSYRLRDKKMLISNLFLSERFFAVQEWIQLQTATEKQRKEE
ncbi:hypothetical protein DFR59_101341 [Falsibacillus pallidus]|uniref:Uncharacterized protein n=1 Tax=Falsibacillus pallidus TaxID=493781 RepID=A0A370GVH9_9BACI|nr:hypothetical protein DFR59_101341 [Falsibacillus pallidus]